VQSEKVHFTAEKETMLITLYARSMESRSKDPVLRDKWAEDAINRIDYDFGKLKVREINALSIAIRAKNFDLWTTQYLVEHPDRRCYTWAAAWIAVSFGSTRLPVHAGSMSIIQRSLICVTVISRTGWI